MMSGRNVPSTATSTRLIVLTVALMIVSVPHVIEDFHYGGLLGFGASPALAAALLFGAYALPIAGITLTMRGLRAGPLLLGITGAVWCVGAVFAHGHDLLLAGPEYRHGPISKILEIAIIILSAGVALESMVVSRALSRRTET
jgi:hypothetical protein